MSVSNACLQTSDIPDLRYPHIKMNPNGFLECLTALETIRVECFIKHVES